MPSSYSGKTLVSYGHSSGNSSTSNSRGGSSEPTAFGERVTFATGSIRVPVEENGMSYSNQVEMPRELIIPLATGQIKTKHRGGKYDVVVVNHGRATK